MNNPLGSIHKKTSFLDTPQWKAIVDNVHGIMTSDGTMAVLLDFERVLDEADIYAFKNWKLGELVDGPIVGRYTITCTFMWPSGLMPDPRGAKRLLPLGCTVGFKKTTVEVPVQINEPSDYKAGTHYPKLSPHKVWLVNIIMPRELMNDIREGSVDLAGQTVDLDDLDDAYEKDYDTDSLKDQEGQDLDDQNSMGGMGADLNNSDSSNNLPGL